MPPPSISPDGSNLPDNTYFNDLSQQPLRRQSSENANADSEDGRDIQQSKAKRIACVLCRKRKLRCDGAKPACATCTRLSHDCSYDEVRRKSGPKRGYVKALEARLAQVETLLKKQDSPDTPNKGLRQRKGQSAPEQIVDVDAGDIDLAANGPDVVLYNTASDGVNYDPTFSGGIQRPAPEPIPQEVMGLGLEEPMPNADVIAEL